MRNGQNDRNRIISSFRNMFSSAVTQLVIGIIAFFERAVFLSKFSEAYLGLNSLFANVLNVFSLTELGLSTAITFALYRPLAEEDKVRVAAYIGVYKKAYSVIGTVIIIVGLAFSPFVDLLVTSDEPIEYISVYFAIYLLSVALTYYSSYKQVLLEADQKRYVQQYALGVGNSLKFVLQILVLVLFGDNFFIYLLVFFCTNIGTCVVLAKIVDKRYPYIKELRGSKLERDERNKLIENVKAMCFHKFGAVAVKSSDSILISAFVNVATLGLYGNYQMVTESLDGAMRIFCNSVMASIGNIAAVETDETIYSSFRSLNFTNYVLFSATSILLFNLVQPIISLWLGSQYILPTFTVFLISFSWFLTGLRRMLCNYHDAMGLFVVDKYRSVVEALVNLVVSVALGLSMGIDGIIIGTITSNIIGILIEGAAVYPTAFGKKAWLYYWECLSRSLFTIVMMWLIHYVCSMFNGLGPFMSLVTDMLSSVALIIIGFVLVYFRNADFKSMVSGMKNAIKVLHNN